MSVADIQPVQYLFRTPSVPQVHAATLTATSASFDKFKADLQQQLTYRTPLLNDALSTIESRVQALHDEVQVIRAEGGSLRYILRNASPVGSLANLAQLSASAISRSVP